MDTKKVTSCVGWLALALGAGACFSPSDTVSAGTAAKSTESSGGAEGSGVGDGADDAGADTSGATMTSMGMNSPTDGTSSRGPTTDAQTSSTTDAMTAGLDDSTSGSTGGDATTGPGPCDSFCADYFDTCGGHPGNDYVTEALCVSLCEGNAAVFLADGCRETHLDLAVALGLDPHCAHASANGGGVCQGV